MTEREYTILNGLCARDLLSLDDMRLIHDLNARHPELKLTGSSCWGALKPNDIDVMVRAKKDATREELSGRPVTTGGSTQGSLKIEASRVNIVCVDAIDYEIWSRATDMMSILPYVENKATRIGIFEALRGLTRLAGGYVR